MLPVKKTFTSKDQREFSKISGDYNPIHLDPKLARRSMFGRIIVHGIHAVLWAICEQGKKLARRTITLIEVEFINNIPVGEEIDCVWNDKNNTSEICISCKEQISIKIYLKWSYKKKLAIEPINTLPPKEKTESPNTSNFEKKEGSLNLYSSIKDIKSILPEVANQIPDIQIAIMLSITRLIGNKCPGLNSIFTSMKLIYDENSKIRKLKYHISNFDERFGELNFKLYAPYTTGSAKAFLRPKPISQKSYSTIKSFVNPNEFNGVKALVIGGSRGLGEVATKLLSAGGSDVTFTYFSGKKEAEKIIKEISKDERSIKSIRFDVNQLIEKDFPNINLLVYMSTPFIFSAIKGRFSNDLFQNFLSHYVEGFSNICCKLAKNNNELRVLYPSSIAIEELPSNMGEYAAAKSAAEIVCKFLERNNKNLKIYTPRLNRLETDQTVSVLPQKIEDPVPTLLRELRITLNEIRFD